MKNRMTALIALCAAIAAMPSPVGGQEAGGPHLEIRQVLEAGDRGPTLLLLPCAGCGAAAWSAFMEANADRFRMIAVTLPGYAGTPRPELPLWTGDTPFQDNAVDQVSALIDQRGLEEVVLVGQSFGATIGLLVAAARPDVVRALVAVDATPLNTPIAPGTTPEQLLAGARASVDEDWAVRLQDPEAFRRFNGATTQPTVEERKSHHGMFMASDRVSMLHYWRENLLRDNDPAFRSLSATYLDVKSLRPRDPSPDSTLAAHVDGLEIAGLPSGYRRVVFHDTSHWVHLDHPRTLGTVIQEHLAGREPPDIGPFRFGEVVHTGSGTRDVILMPCLGCDASSWNELMRRNEERYRMVALTWPGLGHTALPTVPEDPEGTPYFDFLVRSLELLIESEGLDRPVLVGHSAAAVVAVRFAAEHPELVGGVVNVDATVANGDTYGFTAEQRRAWADTEMADVLDRYDDDRAWAELNRAPSGMSPERSRHYERMWAAPPRDHVFAYWRDWLRTDAGAVLPDLTVPFLAVHALPADSLAAEGARVDAEQRYRRAPLPAGARVVFVERSGHTIWEYRPDAFDRVLAEFVLGATGLGNPGPGS